MGELWLPSGVERPSRGRGGARGRVLLARSVRVLTGDDARRRMDAKLELAMRGIAPIAGGSEPGAGFTVTSTAVALSAATAKTVLGLSAGTTTPVNLIEFAASGDATTGNLLIELVYGTGAGAGTSTSFTPLAVRGPPQSLIATGSITYSAEPTVLTVVKRWRFPWPGGPFVLQAPLGREGNSVIASSTMGKFVGIRATSSVAVTNSDWYAETEE